MKKHKTQYRRNLPHLQPKDGVFAITACLSGSLPKAKIEHLRAERDLQIKTIKSSELSSIEQQNAIKKAQNIYFGKFDDLLDGNSKGPQWLSTPEIAQIVVDSLHYLDGRSFKLVCYCVMSNHIHFVVYQCEQQLFEIMKSFKNFTALKANDVIYGKAKKGERRPSFWQHESYDHLIEDRQDFYFQVQYATNNPVKARLVKNWKDWKFSYIRKEFEYIVA